MLIENLNHGVKLSTIANEYNNYIKIIEKVLSKFPDTTLIKEKQKTFGFISKSANLYYNHLEFLDYGDLWVYPFYKTKITIDDKEVPILIRTNPKKFMLVRKSYNYITNKRLISFPLSKFNFKRNNFDSDKLFKDCKSEILKHLKKNNDYEINTENADINLIKLLNII